jgi:hypothetical protein
MGATGLPGKHCRASATTSFSDDDIEALATISGDHPHDHADLGLLAERIKLSRNDPLPLPLRFVYDRPHAGCASCRSPSP